MSVTELDSATQQQLADDLLESDSRYFEYGACNDQLDGAVLSYMTGLTTMASGCVVHRITPTPRLKAAPDDWLAMVEDRVRAAGSRHPRLYLTTPIPELEQVLSQRGYSPRTEPGYFFDDPDRLPQSDVELVEIEDDAAWAAKLEVHRQSEVGPDGHTTPAELWVSMERRKSEASGLRFYLIMRNDSVSGCVGADDVGDILRLKNIVVLPSCRRQGIAGGTIKRLGEVALNRGCLGVGVFSVRDEPGDGLYRNLGLSEITRQTEWMRRGERSN